MKTKIKTASTGLCAALAALCFASCFATDPAAVYSKAYATSYQWARANGCNEKQAESLAKSNAESARDEAMRPINSGNPPDYELIHIPEQDMANRLGQAGGTHIPQTTAAPAASMSCPSTMHH